MSSLLPQQTHATRNDPNAPTASGRHGGVGGYARSGEYGTVIAYNADTYTATVNTPRGVINGVPRLQSTPGQVAPLARGTEVLVSYEFGDPIILGTITRLTKNDATAAKFSATDTEGFGGQGLNKDLSNTDGTYRNPSEPDDVMPGDWVQASTDGNMLGVLAGGVNTMKSSPLAQIRTHLINDLVEIISRNYRHISDMGEMTVTNNDGRINMKFRGASDQRTEAGPDEENWTIKFDLGAEGDLFNLELCTTQGQTLFKFHVDSDGQCEIYGLNGVSINSGSKNNGVSAEESTGNKAKKINGNQSTEIGGADDLTVKGNATTVVYNNYRLRAGNDLTMQATRDCGISAGRNMFVAVQGSALGDAMVFDIEAGNWIVDIGSPTSINPKSGFELSTFAGDVKFSSLAAGNFSWNSPLGTFKSTSRKATLSTNNIPDSVVLGGEFITSHIAKFEQLQLHLMTLYNMLDTHTHAITSTANAGPFPVVGVTAMPIVPFTPILSPQIATIRSLTSGVAG